MKKILIMAMAVIATAISHAASINWGVNTESWKNQNGSDPALGTAVWMVDADFKTSIIAALKDKTEIDFSSETWKADILALDGVYAQGATTDGAGQMLSAKFSTSKATAIEDDLEAYYSLAALFIDTTSSSDTVYYNITQATDAESYFSNDDDSLDTLTTSAPKVSSGTGWLIAQQAPEPTSGLLMLIGMAGLALRRRRA